MCITYLLDEGTCGVAFVTCIPHAAISDTPPPAGNVYCAALLHIALLD
jgi:hypothetical protein